MNFVDLIIIALLVIAIQRGMRTGFLRLLGSSIGIVIGVWIGSILASNITLYINGITLRMTIAAAIITLMTVIFMTAGDVAGNAAMGKSTNQKLQTLNKVSGSTFEVLFALLFLWVIAGAVSDVKAYSIGYSVRHSGIFTSLNTLLPPPPDVVADLENLFGTNGLPSAFVGNEPNHPPISKNVTIKNAATDAAQESVVRIIGEGCDGAVQGSGFVLKPNVVMTNAHVVAGIKEPYVYKGTTPHAAQTVYFDQDYDIAILRTTDMGDIAPLRLSQTVPADQTPVLVMGYPDNGALTISGGAVLDSINARGRNIYDRGLITRQIYEVSINIEQGNSGGPMIATDGTVAGLVFGRSVTNATVGYVLPSSRLSGPLSKFGDSTTKVSTSKCVY